MIYFEVYFFIPPTFYAITSKLMRMNSHCSVIVPIDGRPSPFEDLRVWPNPENPGENCFRHCPCVCIVAMVRYYSGGLYSRSMPRLLSLFSWSGCCPPKSLAGARLSCITSTTGTACYRFRTLIQITNTDYDMSQTLSRLLAFI